MSGGLNVNPAAAAAAAAAAVSELHGLDNTSQFMPSSYLDNISALLIDTKSNSNNSSFIHVNNNNNVSSNSRRNNNNNNSSVSGVSGGSSGGGVRSQQLELRRMKQQSDETIVFQSRARGKLKEIEEQVRDKTCLLKRNI